MEDNQNNRSARQKRAGVEVGGGGVEMKIPKFPEGMVLHIEVVFPELYRIGFDYKEHKVRSGFGKYYPWKVAIWRAWGNYCYFLLKKPVKK